MARRQPVGGEAVCSRFGPLTGLVDLCTSAIGQEVRSSIPLTSTGHPPLPARGYRDRQAEDQS
jgi:hypothetical protein